MRELDNKLSKMNVEIGKPEAVKKYEKNTNVPEMLKCYICESKIY